MQVLPRRRQKLSDLIVQDVKRWIVTERLTPGDRLPNERELIERYQCGKGTVREALKALEVEGLIMTRTGPGGGAYLTAVGHEHVSKALRNYLHFQKLDGTQIYQLRRIIETELAASVVGRLREEDFEQLEENIRFCHHQPVDDDEQRAQRAAELDFHNLLAQRCPNPLLAYLGEFLNHLLLDLVDWKQAYRAKRCEFGDANSSFHARLVEAYRAEDIDAVRRLMEEHMQDAEAHLTALELEVTDRFLLEPENRRFQGMSGMATRSTHGSAD